MIACFGNDEVVLALETLLAKAKEGKVGYCVALMVSEHGQGVSGGWFGADALEPPAIQALEQTTFNMKLSAWNKMLPDCAPTTPANRVCYNVCKSPMSFDFINWLMDAEMTRRRAAAPAPLRVAFWFGRDGQTGLNTDQRTQMFHNVLRPALALAGAVEDPTAVDGHFKMFYSSKDIVEGYLAGEEMPRLKAPADKLAAMKAKFSNAVVITLREAPHFPHRNSNLDAWIRFAHYLKSRGERVVFVRDTSAAGMGIAGFEVCPQASVDLHWRLALYEASRMNLFVSNGPGVLGHFGDWPWMTFVKIEDDGHIYIPNTPGFFKDNVGIEVGSQFPWCHQDQRMIWASDSYDNLVKAWEQFHDRAAQAAE